jgi:hypothetical protein
MFLGSSSRIGTTELSSSDGRLDAVARSRVSGDNERNQLKVGLVEKGRPQEELVREVPE